MAGFKWILHKEKFMYTLIELIGSSNEKYTTDITIRPGITPDRKRVFVVKQGVHELFQCDLLDGAQEKAVEYYRKEILGLILSESFSRNVDRGYIGKV